MPKPPSKVDVLIPPPADPDDAPTNIKKRKTIKTGTESAAVSTTLNPAFLVVMDMNKECAMSAIKLLMAQRAIVFKNKEDRCPNQQQGIS